MGLTGLLLVAFLVEHLLGNFKLFEDPSGNAFNEYVRFFRGFGWILTVAEITLAVLFLCHIVIAIQLTLENRSAREEPYIVRSSHGAASFGSLSMHLTGVGILGYLLKHLYDFRFDGRFFEDPAGIVKRTLSNPAHAIVYIGAALLVGLHLSHGFRSAFQSIGVAHPKWTPLLEALGKVLAILFALGFASFPIYFLFFWSE